MKKRKKYLIVLIALCLLVLMPSQIVSAKSKKHTSGSCYWKLSSSGTLTIWPKKESGCLASQSTWNEYRNFITRVVVKPGVKAKNCGNMFRGFVHCREMDLSGLDTSRTTNMSCMFQDCSELRYLDLSHFDTSHVESMDFMFYHNCA